MARDLGRSQSSVADEVMRNRTVTRGPGKGARCRVYYCDVRQSCLLYTSRCV